MVIIFRELKLLLQSISVFPLILPSCSLSFYYLLLSNTSKLQCTQLSLFTLLSFLPVTFSIQRISSASMAENSNIHFFLQLSFKALMIFQLFTVKEFTFFHYYFFVLVDHFNPNRSQHITLYLVCSGYSHIFVHYSIMCSYNNNNV